MLKKKINLDKTLILYVSIFAIISLISIYSASMYLSKTLGNLVLKQAMWSSWMTWFEKMLFAAPDNLTKVEDPEEKYKEGMYYNGRKPGVVI